MQGASTLHAARSRFAVASLGITRHRKPRGFFAERISSSDLPVHTFSERQPKPLTRQNFHGTSVLRLFGTSEPFRRVIHFVKLTPTWMNCPRATTCQRTAMKS